DVEGVTLEPGERVVEVGLVYPLQLYTAKGKAAAAGRRMIRIVDHTPDCTACGSRAGRSPAVGTLCRDQLQTIADRAMQAIEEMRGGNIDPDPRDGARTCSGCPFRAICPAPQA
ncbi:MAG: PD-(D/E)XK nuclease family protein, partial [Chloroflexota bacterium]|nr:PD-(D/E)XK nuclease family protein [Chloroflexota bacterium]